MSRPLITVKTLLAQAREQGAIELLEGALVTPAAQDWLRGARLPVRRVAEKTSTPTAEPEIYLVGDAAAPEVRALLPDLQRRHASLQFLPCNGNMAGLMQAVREMCAKLDECTVRRGVAILRDGAGVNCVANRCASVRAAILGTPSALFGLMHELGVNLLIFERERLSLAQIRSSIDSFLHGKSSINPAIASVLAGKGAAIPEQPAGCPCGKPCPCRKQ